MSERGAEKKKANYWLQCAPAHSECVGECSVTQRVTAVTTRLSCLVKRELANVMYVTSGN